MRPSIYFNIYSATREESTVVPKASKKHFAFIQLPSCFLQLYIWNSKETKTNLNILFAISDNVYIQSCPSHYTDKRIRQNIKVHVYLLKCGTIKEKERYVLQILLPTLDLKKSKLLLINCNVNFIKDLQSFIRSVFTLSNKQIRTKQKSSWITFCFSQPLKEKSSEAQS